MRILVTGVAGFIGNHLAVRLAMEGHEVTGIDNLSPYYDVDLKKARLERLAPHANHRLEIVDLCDGAALDALVSETRPEIVVHLAAQPGVRYSLQQPHSYVEANLVAFANVLEACRARAPRHLVFASSSSVYGANRDLPSHENLVSDHPLSLYAATKKANEVMAHSYAHLYGLAITGVRFFTVYGEWGRPDMAFFRFTDAILNGRKIDVYNHGRMSRDFTYVADIVESLARLLDLPPAACRAWDAKAPDTATSGVAPYRLCNAGNGEPVDLMRYIAVLEGLLGRKAEINFMAMQPGEVEQTWADTQTLASLTGFTPQTSIEEGLGNFVAWYKSYFAVA